MHVCAADCCGYIVVAVVVVGTANRKDTIARVWFCLVRRLIDLLHYHIMNYTYCISTKVQVQEEPFK